MSVQLSLPAPPIAWLEALNESYRAAQVAPSERPMRALNEWAAKNNFHLPDGLAFLEFLGGNAFQGILDFFKEHTGFGRELNAPISKTCFFYDGTFWRLDVPLLYGDAVIDPIQCVREMPSSVLRSLGIDTAARDELDAHWFDAVCHNAGNRNIDRVIHNSLGAQFLGGADALLASGVLNLLDVPPSSKAADESRFGFECVLKALAAENDGLTAAEAKKLSHNLNKLVERCANLLPAREIRRLRAACALYPEVKDRYDNIQLPRERLWMCYSEARHAAAIVTVALNLALPIPTQVNNE